MREAIINAFCHRDYRDPDYVQVAIFKDRIEIRNPGELYGGLTIDRIRKGNVSRRRNPLIAELLRRIQMVETWGRGMRLILAKETITQSLRQAEALRQSILKKAFSGKLVPQDPNDEPAEKLLARIRAEKAAQGPVNGPVKRKGGGRKAPSFPKPAAGKR